ncbi:armadillo-type fold-containing protein [Anabaena subtropica]|uniref:Armadillo-type fold-containing protein n=1 Tax=Anabaena subtropica FACHB-260 TaxID=2692884 RepID=A0ABR8CUH0_9NOST|nr:armadillo-type fold-containing protein [Anabaena subtropica]MBD2346847.1 armadillo-type fold-containing protein [Anabaena subtropica FACHB-260]
MVKALSSWQQLINQMPNWLLPELKTKANKRRTFQHLSEPSGLLILLTIIVAMLLWNWKLLLALLVGVGVMLSVYSVQKWDWQLRWVEIQKLVNGTNRRLVIAVGSGGIGTFSTYMAVAILADSHSPWIAAGAIVQGLGTLLTVILLVWQLVKLYAAREEQDFEQLFLNLTEKDPLKRLVTLRRLTKIINAQKIDSGLQREINQCLQLLLAREEEPIVREAAFEGLQALEQLQPLQSSPLPTLIPLSTKVKARVSNS